jgi:outer membrane protein assembly factor BamE (lipoprotein component of BamABCDE complex)
MNGKVILIVLILAFAGSGVGCMSAGEHQKSLGTSGERDMTLGVVQKEIKVGMSQADVATALGSPNIVTKDSDGKETWIYDKIASEVTYSKDSASTGIIISLLGIYGREAGATSKTQRTLTVVIKFDSNSLVESTTYHASEF